MGIHKFTTKLVKNYEFRNICSTVCSVGAGVFLTAYNAANCLRYKENIIWLLNNAVWLFLCLLAKVGILICHLLARNKAEEEKTGIYRIMNGSVAVIMICIVGSIFVFSGVMVVTGSDKPNVGSKLFFFCHAAYVIVKVVLAFLGTKWFKNKTEDANFYRCKKYIARAENVFLFCLMYYNLVKVWGWASLLIFIVNYAFDAGACFYVIGLAINLLVRTFGK